MTNRARAAIFVFVAIAATAVWVGLWWAVIAFLLLALIPWAVFVENENGPPTLMETNQEYTRLSGRVSELLASPRMTSAEIKEYKAAKIRITEISMRAGSIVSKQDHRDYLESIHVPESGLPSQEGMI